MRMLYLLALVLILKDSVSPGLTLIAVAKPWMLSSPISSISQSPGGSPSLVFSQATGFVTGSAQRPVSAAAADVTPPACRKKMNAAAKAATNTEAARLAPRRCLLGSIITPDNEPAGHGTFGLEAESDGKKD